MIGGVLNHLWQSTLFVVCAGLLTLILRRNGAHIRFWVWFVSSAKFLVPFAALSTLCRYVPVPAALGASAPTAWLMWPAAELLPSRLPPLSEAVATRLDVATLLSMLWAIGFAALIGRWLIRWWKVQSVLRDAVDMPLAAPVAVKMVQTSLEPGLVGVLRPVILLPRGIGEHLSSGELDAIMAHEICHVRRRDNLLAAIHMLVEALFWFYPPVWWVGARLNAERERACDEGVLESGRAPHVYAESILKVCKLYLCLPVACAAGVSGTNLKERLSIIMRKRCVLRLNWTRKLALGGAAALTIATPLVFGSIAPPPILAQAFQTTVPSPEVTAERAAEQALPRKAIPFDPSEFDRYVGDYRLGPTYMAKVTREGSHFFSRLTGQGPVELFPESETKFFARTVLAEVSFDTDASGRVTGLVLHQGGLERHALRVSEAVAQRVDAAILQRIKDDKPSLGTEAALRHQLEDLESGHRDFSELMPALAASAEAQWVWRDQLIGSLGALKSIKFSAVSPQGMDNYDVVFEHATTVWQISPLSADGKVWSIGWWPVFQRKDGNPSPGTEAAVRHQVESLESGRRDFASLMPALGATFEAQWPRMEQDIRNLGALTSIKFSAVSPQGWDIYDVTFVRGSAIWQITPLSTDGKIWDLGWRPVP